MPTIKRLPKVSTDAPRSRSELWGRVKRAAHRAGLTKGISFGHEYGIWLASSRRVKADSDMDLQVPSMSVAQTWQSDYQGYIPLKFWVVGIPDRSHRG